MARILTAAQKKELAAAQALLTKTKTQLKTTNASLAKLQADQKTLADADAEIAKGLTDDAYYRVKVGTTGKTQAQLDAAKNAAEVATSTGGTIDPKTGYVVPPKKVSGDGVPSDVTLISTETDEYGNVVGIYSDSTTKILIPSGRKYKSTVDEDAYTLLESTFKEFGLEELIPDIKRFMEAGLGSNQAAVELKKTTAYTTRFKGNEIRRAAGLNVMSEAEYLTLENSYNETLRAYGLQGYFGTDRKVSQARMSELIGNDINAPEFKERIDTVVTRVNMSDPNIKATLKSFYNIEDTDLVKYFLSPKENLPMLQQKVTAAEIGNEALKQNLITNVNSAQALAQMGITQAQAREGYQGIKEALPTATKLGQIYGEEGINYTQQTAEDEVFRQLESAKRKRLKLAEKEVGTFSGQSGVVRGSLGGSTSGTF
jgi:hypothetical protein